MKLYLLFFILLSFFNVSCAGPKPYQDYILSQAALGKAKSSGAESFAKSYWYKAEKSYLKAQRHYKLNENTEAGQYFRLSRKYAEKAEMLTRLKKFKSGEVTP